MKRVYLVGCGKLKLDRPAYARYLYTGALFRKSLAYAEQKAGRSSWLNRETVDILSAKHGLVGPDQLLSPYDFAMSDLDRDGRHEWGVRVADTLASIGWLRPDVELVVLAGALYVQALRDGLASWETGEVDRDTMPQLVTPLAGLGIGRRLAWLNAHLDTEALSFSAPPSAR